MSEQEEAQHRQVEDNTTKALINLLEHAEPSLTASFLAEFVATAELDGSPPSYYLQRGPDGEPGEPTWLLGLSVLGELDPLSATAPVSGGSRVDAAIQLPGSALVLIEVKVVEYLDYQQLCRHAERWKLPVLPPAPDTWATDASWKLARWADVYRWAKDLLPEITDDVSRFLLQQFAEYLDLVGLAPFNGFRKEHFDFFAAPASERNWATQSEIKTHLRGMWEAIFEALTPDEASALGEIHTNHLSLEDSAAAAQTNWGEPGTNITIELTKNEIQVNLVGWNADQAEALEAWLAPGGGVGSTSGLDEYELVVFRRRPYNYTLKGQGKRPWYQKETYHLSDRQPLSALRQKQLRELRSQWREEPDPAWEKLAYHVRRAWPRDQAVTDGAGLVPEMVQAIRELMPVVKQINRGL